MADLTPKKVDELKELLEIIKHKVDMMEVHRTNQGASVQLMRDQLSVMNKKLDGLGDRLDDPETGLKGYADSYKANDTNIRKAEKRLEILEEDTGVNVPPELQFSPQSDL